MRLVQRCLLRVRGHAVLLGRAGGRRRVVRRSGHHWHRRGRRGRASGCTRVDLLDMVGGEEPLLAATLARPPVAVGLVDDFDDLSCGEREVVGFLRRVSIEVSYCIGMTGEE